MLVMEGNRLERENRFARLIHRSNRFLEMPRGDDRAELTVGIDNYSYASRDGCPTDASDKGGRLRSVDADVDGTGLALDTMAADIDIVIASDEIYTSIRAQCDVFTAVLVV